MGQKQNGIALLQVLLIVTLISMYVLYLSKTANEFTKLAILSNDRADALLKIKTEESQLLLELLTAFKEPNPSSASKYQRNWNFYARPFEPSPGVTVKIQDQSGLLSVRFPEDKAIENLFLNNNSYIGTSQQFMDVLLDWQDADKLRRLNGYEGDNSNILPRNGPITIKSEVALLPTVGTNNWQKMESDFTLYRRGPFNPSTATFNILSALFGTDIAAQYEQYRQSNTVTSSDFSGITGAVETLEQVFYPGNVLEVEIEANSGGTKISKTIMVELSPYAQGETSPLDKLEERW